MRKYQQKQILQLIRTIEQAQSAGLYADCQEGAVSVGNFIENIVGEGAKTVALLEEYCELLYKASRGEIKEKLLRKHLIKIENSVTDELKPNKIEIAFFPYKASMWDSLESVYLAAKADPNCDAYVVPIPSYELNPDGTLGKMYYDGDQYPGDIPVVDWQTYDIEARHPDVVFTHYAYDDNVNNATIHPEFYSKRLREHCDLMVYIPYFVAVGDTVDEYCGYLPGVLYAHHVIVQSEAVRQSYIEHYKKFDKEFGWKGRFGKAEEKFIALGSPKFDKVINTRREDYELPDEWRRLIHKPDGSRKKVILYNTHMFTWINGGKAYFEKIKSVFESFRSRDDVVLWWRPHPNTELNFRTKRPQWLNEYHMLVDSYKHGGWGIYDQRAELHRALSSADGMISDNSSLVALFQATGKPIMIQGGSWSVQQEKVLVPLALHSNECDIFFSVYGKNILFQMSHSTGIVRLLNGSDVLNKSYSIAEYFSASDCDGKIYFSPSYANKIVSYDYVNAKFSKTPIKVKSMCDSGYKFRRIHVVGNIVYFVGYTFPAIMALDTISNIVYEYNDWFLKIWSKNEIASGKTWLYDSCIADRYIAAITLFTTDIVLFDTTLNISNIYHLKCDSERFSSICYDGNFFWISPVGMRYIIKWNPHGNICVKYNEFPDGFVCTEGGVRVSFCFGDYVYLIPDSSNMILKVDKDNGSISCLKKFDAPAKLRYTECSIYNNKAYLSPYCGNEIEVFDLITEEFNIIKMDLSLIDSSVFDFDLEARNINGENKPFREGGLVSIHLFVDAICKLEENSKVDAQESSSGNKIYRYVKSSLISN